MTPRAWKNAIILAVTCWAIIAGCCVTGILIHNALAAERCTTIAQCHRAIDWQAKDRAQLKRELAVKYNRDASYAIHLASAAFGVSEQNMRTIARCESNLGEQTTSEAGSGASGLFQFLPSTWRRTPFAGFDVFDPLPNALAAAQLVVKDGSWREWSCSSITGVR